MDPHQVGFRVAAMEIKANTASATSARARGLHMGDQESQMAWDRGYEDCVCAHRLGHDVQAMVGFGLFGPSLQSTLAVVSALLDGTWRHATRPDPRR